MLRECVRRRDRCLGRSAPSPRISARKSESMSGVCSGNRARYSPRPRGSPSWRRQDSSSISRFRSNSLESDVGSFCERFLDPRSIGQPARPTQSGRRLRRCEPPPWGARRRYHPPSLAHDAPPSRGAERGPGRARRQTGCCQRTWAASRSPCLDRPRLCITNRLPDFSALDVTSAASRKLPRWMFDSTKNDRVFSTGHRPPRAFLTLSCLRVSPTRRDRSVLQTVVGRQDLQETGPLLTSLRLPLKMHFTGRTDILHDSAQRKVRGFS